MTTLRRLQALLGVLCLAFVVLVPLGVAVGLVLPYIGRSLRAG